MGKRFFERAFGMILLVGGGLLIGACGAEAPSDPEPATGEASDAETIRLQNYCKATMECEGANPNAIHHVCMVAPIPFGMMLCEGANEKSVNACVAAVHTFRDTAAAYDCSTPFQALTNCLIDKSVCVDATFDQSACKAEMKGLTSCVDKASANHASVPQLPNTMTSCEALGEACKACSNDSLVLQCKQVSSIGDDGTCAQALSAVRQSCQ
ncbi:MAG: hypothetical protein U0359_33265 [Byssovorax sp.]